MFMRIVSQLMAGYALWRFGKWEQERQHSGAAPVRR